MQTEPYFTWRQDLTGALRHERCSVGDCPSVPLGAECVQGVWRNRCRVHAPPHAQTTVPVAAVPRDPLDLTARELLAMAHSVRAFEAAWAAMRKETGA